MAVIHHLSLFLCLSHFWDYLILVCILIGGGRINNRDEINSTAYLKQWESAYKLTCLYVAPLKASK
jgi:hypothetical protein